LDFGTRKTSELLITESDQVDLSKARYSLDLSFTGLDEDSSRFCVTMDRIPFHKPLDIVMTVLEANGFASNFENLLSCFDSLVQGVRIRTADKGESIYQHIAKAYNPCLSFQLPSKERVGFLLKKFYGEIEAYELELARLRTDELGDPAAKKQSRDQLKREIERLQVENGRLQSRVDQLTGQLAQTMKSEAHVTKALESNKIIPPQLRAVIVREISLQDRSVTMKSGRSSYVVPMFMLRTLPKIGDPCLLNLKGEEVIDSYFYESPGSDFETEMADVLHVSEGSCKLRDAKRKTHVWSAKYPQEVAIIGEIKRGSKVIMSSYGEVIVKLSVVSEQKSSLWTQPIQEKSTVFQVERSRQADSASLPIFDRKG
jgi:hypothetical protein